MRLAPRIARERCAYLVLRLGLDDVDGAPVGDRRYDVVGKIAGEREPSAGDDPAGRFGVSVVRTAPNRWRAVVRFPRPGTWRLLIPNEAPARCMIPPPLVRRVVVR